MFNQTLASHLQPQDIFQFPAEFAPLNSDALTAIADNYNVRAITMTELRLLAQELLDAGHITLTQQKLMSFKVRLYSDTPLLIGLLGNIKAEPDGPRNFLQIWKNIAAILNKEASNYHLEDHALHIVKVLERMAARHDASNESVLLAQ